MKNKIILLILHVISVCAFATITGYSFYIKDTVTACFGIIAVLCWLSCAVFDILDLRKPVKKEKGNNFAENVDELCRHFENADNYVKIPDTGIGDVSDGYHTFNELYHHRAVLFSVICSKFPDKAWKSKLHDTGDMFDGMFIVGIETEHGQATYHYDIDPYWDMFNVTELEKAPTYDGHTPSDAINRIATLRVSNDVATD